MAIKVSYLAAKAHPDWAKFSNQFFPHKPGQVAPVDPGKGGFGNWPGQAVDRGSVEPGKGGFGTWPRITPSGGAFTALGREALAVAAGKGGFDNWPRITPTSGGFGGTFTAAGREPTPVPPGKGPYDSWPRIKPSGGTYTDAGREPTPVPPGKGGFDNWPRITTVSGVQDRTYDVTGREPKPVAAAKGPYGSWPTMAAGAPETEKYEPLSQHFFALTLGSQSLGLWSKIEGLSVRLEMAEHRTGDGDNFRWYEPSFTTYGNIKVTRASSFGGSKDLLAWIAACQFGWNRDVSLTIEARPNWKNNANVWKLELIDVMPVSWTGPQFNSTGGVATETLELAHNGFLDNHGDQVKGF